jgi:hypothetical protein
MTHSVRLPGGETYNFEQGIAIRGAVLSSPDGAKVLGLQLPGDTSLRRLYDWVIEAETRISASQASVPFATGPEAIAGLSATKPVGPMGLKAIFDAIRASTPTALDTFAEFANAIGNDPQFATHIFALIAAKAPSASPTFTGLVTLPNVTSQSSPQQAVNIGDMEAAIENMLLGLMPPPNAPVLDGVSFAVVGTDYVLSMSAVPSDPRLSIAEFQISFGTNAPVVVTATGNSAVYSWPAAGTTGVSLDITVLAKDNKNKFSTSTVKTITMLAELIQHPTIIYPAANASNVEFDPVIELSPFTVNVGSDTHVATSWVIREISSQAVVWQSTTDATNLTTIHVPLGYLAGSRQYTVEATYHGLTLGVSGVSRQNFTTAAQKVAPAASVNGSSNAVFDNADLTLVVNSTMTTSPDTAVVKYSYSIGSPNNPVDKLSVLSQETLVIPYNQVVFNNQNQATLYVWVTYNHTGVSAQAQITLTKYVAQQASFTYPSYVNNVALFDIPVKPVFQTTAYVSNVPGDTHQSTVWTLTNLDSNFVELTETTASGNLTSWTPSKQMAVGSHYAVTAKQVGAYNTAGTLSKVSQFYTEMNSSVKVQQSSKTLSPTALASATSIGLGSVAISHTGDKIMFGDLAAAYARGAVYTLGRSVLGYSEQSANLVEITSPIFMAPDNTYYQGFGFRNALSPDGSFAVAGGFNSVGDANRYSNVTVWDTALGNVYGYGAPSVLPGDANNVNISHTWGLAASNAKKRVVYHSAYRTQINGINGTWRHVVDTIAPNFTDQVQPLFLSSDNTSYNAAQQYDPRYPLMDGKYVNLSISADGNTLAVCSPYQAGANGDFVNVVTVYQVVNKVWVVVDRFSDDIDRSYTALQAQNDLAYMNTMSMSGDGNTIVLAGRTQTINGSTSGEVNVFTKTAGVWSLSNTLNPNVSILDRVGLAGLGDIVFGQAVSINHDGTVMAVLYQDQAQQKPGFYDIWRQENGTWVEMGYRIEPASGVSLVLNAPGYRFGSYDFKLSGDGSTLAVSEPYSTIGQGGAILIYKVGNY